MTSAVWAVNLRKDMNLKDISKLHYKKYRDKYRCFLAEGEHLVHELVKAAEQNLELRSAHVYVTEKYKNQIGFLPSTVIDEKQMSRISDTKSPQGVIAKVPFFSIPEDTIARGSTPGSTMSRAVYLHEVQDPGNLGAILRTLAWFGGFRCLLSPGSVDPFHAKVVRASMGAIFHVPVETEVSLEAICHRYQKIACLDLSGESVTAPSFKASECYLFGNEARGVPRELLDKVQPIYYNIRGGGMIESLNLAAAVHMSIYEISR